MPEKILSSDLPGILPLLLVAGIFAIMLFPRTIAAWVLFGAGLVGMVFLLVVFVVCLVKYSRDAKKA